MVESTVKEKGGGAAKVKEEDEGSRKRS
ncbi:hypothetical protein CCACVL1_06041 [Corchorus capsularis]|uniref:Uncharacterized protein n=1 Tax=Corchorus capsularis TaxID=210143 RepID=A0A1R3JHP0_COCAP|nr:hypothetical protein CCACVL1_06041 [Corchorus capsularis]